MYIPCAIGNYSWAAELVSEDVVTLPGFGVGRWCIANGVFITLLEVVVAILGCQQAGFVFPEVFFNYYTIDELGNPVTEGVMAVGNRVLWCVYAQSLL
jgi:hypothetical protein